MSMGLFRVLYLLLALAESLSLAPFSRPPLGNVAPSGPPEPLGSQDMEVLKQARMESISRHAIFLDGDDDEPDPGLVDRSRELLVSLWHGVDRSDLLAESFVFASPVRVRGTVSFNKTDFIKASTSLELRNALFSEATPTFYNFHEDPFDARTVAFVSRAERKASSPPRQCILTFDDDDKATILTIGRPLLSNSALAVEAERDAANDRATAKRSRSSLATSVRSLFAARPAADAPTKDASSN